MSGIRHAYTSLKVIILDKARSILNHILQITPRLKNFTTTSTIWHPVCILNNTYNKYRTHTLNRMQKFYKDVSTFILLIWLERLRLILQATGSRTSRQMSAS